MIKKKVKRKKEKKKKKTRFMEFREEEKKRKNKLSFVFISILQTQKIAICFFCLFLLKGKEIKRGKNTPPPKRLDTSFPFPHVTKAPVHRPYSVS